MRAALMAVLVAAVLVAAGCGGSSSTTAAGTTAATTEAATTDTTSTDTTSTDTTSTDTTSTDTTSTDTTSTDSGLSDAGAAAAGLSAGCKKVADLSVEFSKALTAAGANGTNGQADLQATADAYKSFASQAPEEIRGAFQTVAEAFAQYADALKGVDLSSGKAPDAATIAKLAKAAKELDNAKLTEASKTISDWVRTNCSGSGG